MDPVSVTDLKTKLMRETMGTLGVLLLNLGKQTGIMEALRGGDKLSTSELCARSGVSERYLEEWCRAAVLHGYLQLHCSEEPAAPRPWDSGMEVRGTERFSMSPQMEEIMFDVASPHYYGHTLSLPMHLCGQSFKDLVAAFKTDAGVAYTSYGEEFPEFVAVSHTRMYQTQAKNWLNDKALEDISTQFNARGGSVLDLGCGNGMSSISVAAAFPKIKVHAVDCDETSMDKARINITEAEREGTVAAGQVVPHCCLAHEAKVEAGTVDLVLVWVALHDMHNPSHVLDTVRDLLRPGGAVLVLEFNSPDNFASVASDTSEAAAPVRGQAQFCLSVSTLHCLPVAKALNPSQAIGTAFSMATMKKVAAKAGFTDVTSFSANDTMTMFVLRKR